MYKKKCIRAQVEVGKSVNYFSQSTPKGLFTHVDIVNTPRVAQRAVCLCIALCTGANETDIERKRVRETADRANLLPSLRYVL